MSKFGAFLSGLAGIAVLAGYFVTALKDYYLVVIGGVLALIAAFVSARRTY